MKTRTLLASALLVMSMTAAAQEAPEYQFRKHAYLQLQGGAQYTLGEAKFADLISPNVQLGVGYRFTPVFGARLAVNAWQSRGGFNGYVGDNGLAGNVTYKYNYVAPGVDFTVDLSNALCGYNPKRVVNLSLFAGGGANIAFSNDEARDIHAAGYDMAYIWEGTKVRPYGRAGIGIDFRISDAVSLGIEGNANVISDKYNSKKAGNADWYFNVLAGVKIALGKTHTKKAPTVPVQPVAETVAETPAPTVVEQPAAEVKAEPLRRDVFFAINSREIVPAEASKVAELAAYLKENVQAKIVVTGYADAGTGTDAINDRLAAERADAVAASLTGEYGIAADRVTVKSEGSRVQPFGENDMNRVSVCVAE